MTTDTKPVAAREGDDTEAAKYGRERLARTIVGGVVVVGGFVVMLLRPGELTLTEILTGALLVIGAGAAEPTLFRRPPK